MTLYPDNVIDMIDTRLSREHSRLFASMNPKQPDHKIKKWIDKAEGGNPLYYSLHFTIDDNPFLPPDYRTNLKDNLKGLFYKRNYLGLWCMAEGAIFDFFDRKIHVRVRPPSAAEYYVAGIDYGTSRVFACVLVGISTGRTTQTGKKVWVEKEYYWNVGETNRQKTNTEYLRDLQAFLDGYPLKGIYIDPSASAFKLEMRRAGFPTIDGNNDVLDGIQLVSQMMADGTLTILNYCHNLIREVESYVWDTRKGELGEDAPVKKNDHAIDALRYIIATHKIAKYDPPDETPGGFTRRSWP
jgi:PBSX family phage terminase large subunit